MRSGFKKIAAASTLVLSLAAITGCGNSEASALNYSEKSSQAYYGTEADRIADIKLLDYREHAEDSEEYYEDYYSDPYYCYPGYGYSDDERSYSAPNSHYYGYGCGGRGRGWCHGSGRW